MKNVKVISKRIIALLLAVIFAFAANISAYASANSGALTVEDDIDNETINYRAYLEYIIPQYNSDGSPSRGVTAGVIRQNIMHTYVKAGETVYFGSSVYDSMINEAGNQKTSALTGSDIVVTYPDGSLHSFDVEQNGVGFIDTRAKETNGPRIAVGDTDEDKYIPLSFTAQVSGLYDFSFRSRTGAVAAGVPTKIYDDQTAVVNQGTSDIAYWDITVADQDGNPITGRTYAKYLAMTTGATWASMTALFYVVTNDGYIYKSYFENFQPYGFIFFSNNQGLTTTGQTASSIYHSVYDNDNNCDNIENEEYVTFHHPYAPDTDLAQTNMIFFEEPSKDLIGVLFDEPVVPQPIEEVLFYGHEENKTYYTQGGEFKFESHGATSVSLVIDFNISINDTLSNPDTDPNVLATINKYRADGGSGVVEINGATVEGWNTFVWDGTDNNNVHMPVGVYNADEIVITSVPKAGEIHFPMLDVEGIYTGLRIERLNGAGGRDSDDPSDERFGICYNNNPLIYGTIEGPLSDAPPVLSRDGAYYILSDGTRSFRFESSKDPSLGGAAYFQAGYIPTTNYANMHQPGQDMIYNICTHNRLWEHHSTLAKNEDYIPPEEEEFGEYVGVNALYGHVPINSQEQNMTFGTNGGNGGGGNQAAIDIGTYYYGEVRSSVKFKTEIEIIDNTGVGEVSGLVFFDDYNNGKYNKKYAPVDGDYPLSDIMVKLVDINGTPLTYVDENGNVKEYVTYTDLKGYYTFRGIKYIVDGQNIGDIYVKTYFTDTQRTAYTLNTTENDFNLSPKKQSVRLTVDNPVKEFGDIGYTTNEKNLVDLTVSKAWDDNLEQREDGVQIKLYQVDPKTNASKLYSEKYLSATNGWKYTFTNLNKTYKYYVEEYVDTGFDGDVLVGTSQAKFINSTDFDSEITSSTTGADDRTGYIANFTFNPNIVGPTIVITNKEYRDDYTVVFHSNFDGYSGVNTNDLFRVYHEYNCEFKQDGQFELVENDDTIEAFYDIPERKDYVFLGWYYDSDFNKGTKPLKWTTDSFTGDDATDNDGDKYSITDEHVYHIYAHWEPVGYIAKDADDEKILKDSDSTGYYRGFNLFGVQIRDYRIDPNYEDEDGNKKSDEWYYTTYNYKKEVHGLRYVTSIRNGLLDKVNSAYDVDAQEMHYDYLDTKTYSKDTSVQNLDYGYAMASEANWIQHYNGFTKNREYYDKYGLVCLDKNNNGVDTSKYYRFVANTPCTSSIGPNYIDKDNYDAGYNTSTNILDHRNYKDYRIMSAIVTYNELTDTVSMGKTVIARPYLKYIDSNGLDRYYYSDYSGESTVANGCNVSYDYALSHIQEELDNVIKPGQDLKELVGGAN